MCIFWRPSRETLVRHRCPLWDETIGLTPVTSIALDMLHTFYLGPLQAWARVAVWYVIDSPMWTGRVGNVDEKVHTSLAFLKNELFAFYKAYASRPGGEVLSRVSDLKPKMVGTTKHRKLKLKAMETGGIAWFLHDFLSRHSANVDEKGRLI